MVSRTSHSIVTCERDGNGNVVEIVTKELINRRLVDLPVAAEPSLMRLVLAVA